MKRVRDKIVMRANENQMDDKNPIIFSREKKLTEHIYDYLSTIRLRPMENLLVFCSFVALVLVITIAPYNIILGKSNVGLYLKAVLILSFLSYLGFTLRNYYRVTKKYPEVFLISNNRIVRVEERDILEGYAVEKIGSVDNIIDIDFKKNGISFYFNTGTEMKVQLSNKKEGLEVQDKMYNLDSELKKD